MTELQAVELLERVAHMEAALASTHDETGAIYLACLVLVVLTGAVLALGLYR
jgi:hypothetical protein